MTALGRCFARRGSAYHSIGAHRRRTSASTYSIGSTACMFRDRRRVRSIASRPSSGARGGRWGRHTNQARAPSRPVACSGPVQPKDHASEHRATKPTIGPTGLGCPFDCGNIAPTMRPPAMAKSAMHNNVRTHHATRSVAACDGRRPSIASRNAGSASCSGVGCFVAHLRDRARALGRCAFHAAPTRRDTPSTPARRTATRSGPARACCRRSRGPRAKGPRP